MTDSMYEQLRARYRPSRVRLLLIGESAPDPGECEAGRFFYASELTAADNLFRGVVEALYDHRFPPGSAGISKEPWLQRFVRDGVFLIDLVPFPVNRLGQAKRAEARRAHIDATCRHARALQPEGVLVCHAPTFRVVERPLREADLTLLHDDPLPFPLGKGRRDFVAGFRRAVVGLGLDTTASSSWATTPRVRKAMRSNRSRDTGPERRLRSELHGLGLRFRKDVLFRLDGVRVRPDVIFPSARVAVFLDGCFWHRCPEHASDPKANSDYWAPKLEANVHRDRRADAALAGAGWEVIRVWEHEPPDSAARRVATVLAAR